MRLEVCSVSHLDLAVEGEKYVEVRVKHMWRLQPAPSQRISCCQTQGIPRQQRLDCHRRCTLQLAALSKSRIAVALRMRSRAWASWYDKHIRRPEPSVPTLHHWITLLDRQLQHQHVRGV